MYAEARLMEYQNGMELLAALYGTGNRCTNGLKGTFSPWEFMMCNSSLAKLLGVRMNKPIRVSVTFVSLVNWGSRLLRQNRIRVITKRVKEFREKKEDVHNYTSPSTHTCTKTELKFSPVRRDIGGLATNHVSENNFS